MRAHVSECRSRLRRRPADAPPALTEKAVALLPVRVLKDELRLARVGGYSGLKKEDLVRRVWGLLDLVLDNSEHVRREVAEAAEGRAQAGSAIPWKVAAKRFDRGGEEDLDDILR